jgi:hypothetical protein
MEQPFYGLGSGGVNGTLRSCYTYNRPLLSQLYLIPFPR